MSYQKLYDLDLIFIRGGADQVKPISRPKDDYDDEKSISTFELNLTQKEEAIDWVEWLKNWLGKKK